MRTGSPLQNPARGAGQNLGEDGSGKCSGSLVTIMRSCYGTVLYKMSPDYLLVARVAPWLWKAGLRLDSFSTPHLYRCQRVGNGEEIRPKDLRVAMYDAGLFWLVMAGLCVIASMVVPLTVYGLLGRDALDTFTPMSMSISSGAFAFSASCYTYAIVRSKRLSLQLSHAGSADSASHGVTEYLDTPQFRDTIVSAALGALTIVFCAITLAS
jgi:hypothetical protein